MVLHDVMKAFEAKEDAQPRSPAAESWNEPSSIGDASLASRGGSNSRGVLGVGGRGRGLSGCGRGRGRGRGGAFSGTSTTQDATSAVYAKIVEVAIEVAQKGPGEGFRVDLCRKGLAAAGLEEDDGDFDFLEKHHEEEEYGVKYGLSDNEGDGDTESEKDYTACSAEDCGYCGHCGY